MGQTGLNPTSRDRLSDIENRLSVLEKSTNLASASIGAGGLRIRDGGVLTVDGGYLQVTHPNGLPTLLAGVFPDFCNGQPVFFLIRNDGSVALQLIDAVCPPDEGDWTQALAWKDRTGNVVIADDTDSSQGLALPYLSPMTFQRIDFASIATTASATFVALEWAAGLRQHPKATGQALIYSDVGTTGEWKIVNNGNDVLGPYPIGAGVFTNQAFGPEPWLDPWSHTEEIYQGAGARLFELQARVLTGAGVIGVKSLGIIGVQT